MPRSPEVAAFAIPAGPTPLPSRPNLEFERKRAKKLLRSIRAGDAETVQRVQRFRGHVDAENVKLADVQLAVAREYGFTSWPKLATYFETWERHERSEPRSNDPGPKTHLDAQVQRLMQQHRNRQLYAAQMLATYVPRFFGRPDSEIFATPLTEADAQLVVARSSRYASWDALLAAPPKDYRLPAERYAEPVVRGIDFIRNNDLQGLKDLVAEHPSVLSVQDVFGPAKDHNALLRTSLWIECKRRGAEARRMTEWLVSQGGEVEPILNHMLIELPFIHDTHAIAFLLDRGADPSWLPPNGVSVLEHAIIRSWNPDVVDLIVRRVTPRNAFWICAGLGDVRGMMKFMSPDGKLIPEAHSDRPDVTAVFFGAPCRPDAEDIDIKWEAFFVAAINRRYEVIDALLDSGLPVDYAPWGNTMLQFAEGNRMTGLAEHLLKRGAKLPT